MSVGFEGVCRACFLSFIISLPSPLSTSLSSLLQRSEAVVESCIPTYLPSSFASLSLPLPSSLFSFLSFPFSCLAPWYAYNTSSSRTSRERRVRVARTQIGLFVRDVVVVS